jgi:hypothetical protein
MSSTINALTSGGGLAMAGDTSGQLALQSNGTTFATGNQYGIGLGTAVPSSGIGIAFPATQSASSDANTLDDYEEGTWTPTPNNMGTTGCTFTGTYIKIGQMVYIKVRITVSAGNSFTSTRNSSVFTGIPFTVSNSNHSVCAMADNAINSYGNGMIYNSNQMFTPTATVSSGNADAFVSGVYQATA